MNVVDTSWVTDEDRPEFPKKKEEQDSQPLFAIIDCAAAIFSFI